MRTILLLILALLAFAGNSLLNREALASGAIDWGNFTGTRLGSGALFLIVLYVIQNRRWPMPRRDAGISGMVMPAALFVYAACFSWAYLELSAATGALILFAFVQITMQGLAIATGTRPGPLEWTGLIMAMGGLVWLLLPGLAAPPLWSAMAMAMSGAAWGVYSWLGRGADDPLRITARNFLLAVPLALGFLFLTSFPVHVSAYGVVLAIASGAITSGLGYAIWYAVLPHISVTNAGVAQLSVPAIAALGGVVLLDEALTLRLAIGGLVILLGIGLTIFAGRTALAKK
ncbi:DMT family transporter [Parasphingorhabdus sp. DH2-15]|uniref:DMT family transporter n=1 Tax=Parasphingorhabdus sp. DH2-15 TaxID=3444112 RepID=UPI003F68472B